MMEIVSVVVDVLEMVLIGSVVCCCCPNAKSEVKVLLPELVFEEA